MPGSAGEAEQCDTEMDLSQTLGCVVSSFKVLQSPFSAGRLWVLLAGVLLVFALPFAQSPFSACVTAAVRPTTSYWDHPKALHCCALSEPAVQAASWRDPCCSVGLSQHREEHIQLIPFLKALLLVSKEKI